MREPLIQTKLKPNEQQYDSDEVSNVKLNVVFCFSTDMSLSVFGAIRDH